MCFLLPEQLFSNSLFWVFSEHMFSYSFFSVVFRRICSHIVLFCFFGCRSICSHIILIWSSRPRYWYYQYYNIYNTGNASIVNIVQSYNTGITSIVTLYTTRNTSIVMLQYRKSSIVYTQYQKSSIVYTQYWMYQYRAFTILEYQNRWYMHNTGSFSIFHPTILVILVL
jgi:hypothetical protein